MITRQLINHGGEAYLVLAIRQDPQGEWSPEQVEALREWYGADLVMRQGPSLFFCERIQDAEEIKSA